MEISNRQSQLLKHIVEEYVYDAQPVSSKEIINKYMKDLSSATIRNDMVALEKLGMLEKAHTSSGRIPSVAGYKYYKENILKSSISTEIKNKLSNVFAARNLSIDVVINEAVEIIKDTFKLPVVITSTNSSETLKRFDLVPLDNSALVMIITSSGNIIQNKINNVSSKQMDDISTCIRVFNDRLIDTPMNQVSEKMESIKDIIRNVVKEYEFCIQQIIGKLFDKKLANTKTNITGRELLPSQPEFRDIEKLGKMLSFLEDTNVWNHISYIQAETGKTAITFGNDIGANKNLVIASTSVGTKKNNTKQLSIVGPSRMDYSKIKGVLDFIQEEIGKLGK